VFKRITGVPPRDFRAKDQSDRALAYRFWLRARIRFKEIR
jgi:hypothetical protein